ncbi:unnamed protein product [Choristocarpus tenellus]
MARRLGNWIKDQALSSYKKSMDRKLRHYGLKLEDLYIEESPDVGEALSRLPPEEIQARNRRLMRAFDISLKRVPLPQHIQDVQKPFEVGNLDQDKIMLLAGILLHLSFIPYNARYVSYTLQHIARRCLYNLKGKMM